MVIVMLPAMAALGFILLQHQVPAIVKDPVYPLRVAETSFSSIGAGKIAGYGHGNVLGPQELPIRAPACPPQTMKPFEMGHPSFGYSNFNFA